MISSVLVSCGDDSSSISDSTDLDNNDTLTDLESDAGSDTESDSDIEGDTEFATDDAVIEISIVNRTNSARYFYWGITMPEFYYGSRTLGCAFKPDDGADFQDCLLNPPGCQLFCADSEHGGDCGTECEPDNIYRQLLPDEGVEIFWPSRLVRADADFDCASGSEPCYESFSAPAGVYRFSIVTFDAIDCGPNECDSPDSDGFYYGEVMTENPTQHALELTLPTDSASFELVLE